MKFKSLQTVYKGLFIFGLMITLASCSSTPKSLSVIPADAKMVAVMDVKTMMEKAQMEDISNYSFFQKAMEQMKKENAQLAEKVQTYMDDPKLLGIDLRKPVFTYGYNSNSKRKDNISITVMDLHSKSNFESFLNDVFSEETGANSNLAFGEFEGYTTFSKDNEQLIAFDSEKVIAIMNYSWNSKLKATDILKDISSLESSKLITKVDAFNSFYKNKKDFSIWMSTASMMSERELNEVKHATGINIEDNFMAYHVAFEDNAIRMTTQFDPNAEITEATKKIGDIEFNKALLERLPKSAYGTMSFAINAEAYHDIIKLSPMFSMMANQANDQSKGMIDKVVSSLGGSVVVTLHDFVEEEILYTPTVWETELINDPNFDWSDYSKYDDTLKAMAYQKTKITPKFSIAMDLKDDDIYNEMIKMLSPQSSDSTDYMWMDLSKNSKMYFELKDHILYASNGVEALKAFETGVLTSSLSSSKIASDITSRNGYGYMNLNIDDYPKSTLDHFLRMKGKDAEVFSIWEGMFDKIEYKVEKDFQQEFVITTNNESGNVLHALLDNVEKTYVLMEKDMHW